MKWVKLSDEEYVRLDYVKYIYLGADIHKVNGNVRLMYHWVFSDGLGDENANKVVFGGFESKTEALDWFSENVEPQLGHYPEDEPMLDDGDEIEPFPVEGAKKTVSAEDDLPELDIRGRKREVEEIFEKGL